MKFFVTPDVYRTRYDRCKSCEEFNNVLKQCKLCHCIMPLKAKLSQSSCPKGYWSSANFGNTTDIPTLDTSTISSEGV